MRNALILTAALLITSCMAPEMVKQRFNEPGSFQNISQTVHPDSVIVTEWWKKLNDPALNRVVDTVIQRNLDLAMALQRVEQFRAIANISEVPNLPGVGANAGQGYSESTIVNNFNPTFGPYILAANKSYSLGLSLFWTFDLSSWYNANAADAEFRATLHDLQGFYGNLIAQTVSSWLEIGAMEQQVELSKRIVQDNENELSLQIQRYSSGLGSKLNIELAKQSLSGSKSKLAAEEAALQKMKHQFAILSGRYPDQRTSVTWADRDLGRIPVGVPSMLLTQRYDIVAAEMRLEAARQRVGAARAQWIPDISITGSYGWNVASADDVFDENLVGQSLSASTNQTTSGLFSAWFSTDQRQAEYRTAVLNYRKAVLGAFVQVENALVDLHAANTTYTQTQINRQASKNVFKLTRDQYLRGVVDYKRFTDVKIANFNAEANYIQSVKNRLLAQVRLIQSVGGRVLPEATAQK